MAITGLQNFTISLKQRAPLFEGSRGAPQETGPWESVLRKLRQGAYSSGQKFLRPTVKARAHLEEDLNFLARGNSTGIARFYFDT